MRNHLFGGDGDDALYSSRGLSGLASPVTRSSARDMAVGLTPEQLAIYSHTDTLTGGAGNDGYHLRGASVTIVEDADPSGGIDTIFLTSDYFADSVAPEFDFSMIAGIENLTVKAAIGATITGSALDNRITGNTGDDSILGGDGNDTLVGGAGGDTLSGQEGNDTIGGRAGNDLLAGGNGDDTLSGGNGLDSIFGGDDADILRGEGDNDTLDGDNGNDTIAGGAGDDSVVGGAGLDVMWGGEGSDSLYGGADGDTLDGGIGGDQLYGGDGDDYHIIDGYDDFVIENAGPGTGSDTVTSSTISLDSFVISNVETLTLTGSSSLNISATTASDGLSLNGNDGTNQIFGGSGDDTITSGGDNDSVFGGDGADTIICDTFNNDTMSGDAGADVFVYGERSSGSDQIEDFADGMDILDLRTLGIDHVFAGVQSDTLSGGVGYGIAEYVGTGSTRIWLDVNGDGIHDKLITLVGDHITLNENDILVNGTTTGADFFLIST